MPFESFDLQIIAENRFSKICKEQGKTLTAMRGIVSVNQSFGIEANDEDTHIRNSTQNVPWEYFGLAKKPTCLVQIDVDQSRDLG